MKNFLVIILFTCFAFASCTKEKTTEQHPYIIPPPVTGKSYSADEITAFKQLTINATSNSRIAKLPAHISVYLADTAYPYLTQELDSIIREMNMLLDTNLLISRTATSVGSTIKVYFTDRDTYIKEEPAVTSELQNSVYTGYASIDWNDTSLIYHGSAFVDMSRTNGDILQQRYILHHEMMHTLGFIGHVSLSQIYTVLFLYPATPYILDYTGFDKKMMLLLYNPAIKPGMNEAEFDSVIMNL